MTSGSDEKNSESPAARLLSILLSEGVISSAQGELALKDCENMSMTLEEVLMARRWVQEDTLQRLAPWLFEEAAKAKIEEEKLRVSGQALTETSGSSDDYGTNLARYRSLMRDILGADG